MMLLFPGMKGRVGQWTLNSFALRSLHIFIFHSLALKFCMVRMKFNWFVRENFLTNNFNLNEGYFVNYNLRLIDF